MRRVLILSMAFGIGGCGASPEEGDGGPQGVAAASGLPTSDTPLPSAPGGAAPTDPGLGASVIEPGGAEIPQGVVLEDGRVVTEDVARSGLTPRAGGATIFRLEQPAWGPKTLNVQPSSTHVCVLSMVWGTLYGNAVSVWKGTQNWMMVADHGTFSGVNEKVALETICYPFTSFVANNATKGVSELFQAQVPAVGSKTVLTWFGDAATFMTGIAGIFAGHGEQGSIVQNVVTNASSTLTMSTQQTLNHLVNAHSIFVGVPGGTHRAQFIGPGGIGNSQVAGEFHHDYNGNDTFHLGQVRMAHSSEAMCYLTLINGRWKDAGEWVQIFIDTNGFWVLNSHATGSDHVHARARCYRLNQTQGQ